jgi:hypothetical protein
MTTHTWFLPMYNGSVCCQIVQIVIIFVFVLLRMVFVLDGVCAGLDCVFLVLSSPCIVFPVLMADLVNLKYLV